VQSPAPCKASFSSVIGSRPYDAAKAAACLQERRAAADVCVSSAADAPSCPRVYSRNAAIGAACLVDSDCADVGAICPASNLCVMPTVAATGQPCGGTLSTTGASLLPRSADFTTDNHLPLCPGATDVCDLATYTCHARSPVGGVCTYSTDCVEGAWCFVNAGRGTCAQRVSHGACSSNDGCVDGQWCRSPSQGGANTCEDKKANGEPCASINQACLSGKCATCTTEDACVRPITSICKSTATSAAVGCSAWP
jgi:hypothetical protein